MVLRAEWMHDDRWWWAVTDTKTRTEIASSNAPRYADTAYTSGQAARDAAEFEARQHAGALGFGG